MEDVKVTEVKASPENIGLVLRSEIDMQIATAKAYPRSITQFYNRLESMATISPDVAEKCGFALPRREWDNATGQYIQKIISGPSIRMAEMAVSAYQNVRVGGRIASNDGRQIITQGICHDLETNVCITTDVVRSILTSKGKTYTADMQAVTANAGISIAMRNAIFRVLPRPMIDSIFEKTKLVALGTAETLVKRRDAAITYFKNLGVKEADICRVLMVKSVNDIDLEKLYLLRSMANALNNEGASITDIFPPEVKEPKTSGKDAKADKAVQDTINMMKENGGANG